MRKIKITTPYLVSKKRTGEKIVVVTAYDATMAGWLDDAGVDVLLVGDTLGMVCQGNADTLSVTVDEMIYHCRSVVRAAPAAHVVCDLPFMSYQISPEQALTSAGRLVKEGGAESVKLEGGEAATSSVRKIVSAGIPVMGHVGLTPQSVHSMGGYLVQGKTRDAAASLIEDARALEEAGVYSIVVEGVPSEVARAITRAVNVPTIGIGAGPDTDGQVLVCYDLLGMYRGRTPKFVRRFRELGSEIAAAAGEFVEAVRRGEFPGPEHSFKMAEGEAVPDSDGES